jgi:hypothetical protein
VNVFGKAVLFSVAKLAEPKPDTHMVQLRTVTLSLRDRKYIVADAPIADALLRGWLPADVIDLAPYLHDLFEHHKDEYIDLCQEMSWTGTW